MMRCLTAAAVALALLPHSAGAADGTRQLLPVPEEWLGVAAVIQSANRPPEDVDPLVAAMTLCEEAGCTRIGAQSLSPAEAQAVRAVFSGAVDAAAERNRLERAIALLETFMGGRNGTWRDREANLRHDDAEPNQLDCVAESVNTRTYLERLHAAGLLRHHQVGGFIHRYTLVLQHVAVEMTENATGAAFAVDSWVGANGEEPEILPYGDWRWEWGV